MKGLASNIAVRVVVLFLMSLSVMGFTTIISYCTMSQSHDCCCSSEEAGQPESQASVPTVTGPDSPCNVTAVAGGVNPVVPNVSSESVAKTLTIDLVTPDAGMHALPVVPHIPLLVHANDVAPPSVEIYIRTAALLI